MNVLIKMLATARLTSLVASDEITEPVRLAVDEWANGSPEGGFRDRVAYLVTCARCISVWAAAAVLLGSYFRPTRPLVKLLAGSQAALAVLTLEEKFSA
jgi:hypothetical protein